MKRVLVVEDELSIAHLIAYNVEQMGYRVAVACDGTDALREVEEFAPHLVTLDLLLPRQSGWEVLDCIRHHPRPRIAALPVIVVSALSSPKLHESLRQHGVRYCLGKPFSITQLGVLVDTALKESLEPVTTSPL